MKKFLALAALIAVTGLSVGCGGGSSTGGGGGNSQPGGVFITGEDAPLPSVLAFNVTLNSITLNNGSNSVAALSAPETVDFARLLGLRTLVAFNTVPAGTYQSATIQLSNPKINYLDLTTNPPSVSTITGTLTTSTVTVAFKRPMVVAENGLAGLKMDFDLRQSVQLDGAGQVTGVVDPHIDLKPVGPFDDDAQITDLRGGLVSVNTANNSFVIQRPHGKQITIFVNNQTTFNPGWSLATLATPAFIEIDGNMQNDGSVLASSVEVVATTHAFLSGRIIAVNPASGQAQTVTMLVGEEMPDIAQIAVGSLTTIDVSAVSDYRICFFDNWFTQALFNGSEMTAGQRIFVGGDYDSSSNAFVPQMISLRRQGVVGSLVQNSVQITNGNRGSFQLQNNFMLGYVLGAPLTVQTGNTTRFYGVTGLSGLQTAGSANLVTHGLMLKDPNTGAPQMWAHRVRVLP